MKDIIRAAAMGCALACVTAPALASAAEPGDTFAADFGYERLSFVGHAAPDFDTVHLRFTAPLNPWFAIEVDGGLGLGDTRTTVSGVNVTSRLPWIATAFAVATAPLGAQTHLTARAGYANAKLKADAGFGRASKVKDGYALGAGVIQDLSSQFALRLEYLRYDFGSADANAVRVGFARRF